MMKTTNEEVQNKRSLTKGIIAIACACALALVGVYAYLTATDQVKNIFGFTDKLDIEVVEPNWHPDEAQNLLPTQTVTKDPALHNPNKVDVYVFADVVIPQKDIVTANADGTLNESAVVDLFSYELNDGWTLKDTIANDDGTVTYRYVYNDVVPAGETSGSIFDEVAIANYSNEQFNTEELAQQIVINGYGTQAVGFANAEEAYAAQFGENEKTIAADITVNDDSIAAGNDYEVKQVETLSTASLSTAAIDDQVIFEDVSLIEDAQYAIVPAGESVDNAIAEFTVDEAIMSAAASTEGVVIGEDNRTAFAVYSADDNSLNFYKRASVPTAGEQFEGKTASNVYTGFETETYNEVQYGAGYDMVYGSSAPWWPISSLVKTVSICDPGIMPQSTSCWFHSFFNLSNIEGLDLLNTSNTTNMSSMFSSCFSLESIDLSCFNTSSVTNMSGMFLNSGLTSINGLSSWDTSNVVSFGSIFRGCAKIEHINGLDVWNLSSAKNIFGIFADCPSLRSISSLSDWDTSQVENMSSAFQNCSSLLALDISNWNTSSATDVSGMFYNCKSLVANCSSWNVTSVNNHTGFNSDAPGVTSPAWTN